jgi:arylsulfatase
LLIPAFAHAQTKKPNVLIIVADDLGFTDLGCYGGEIRTPNLDRLAAKGLRYTQFYNTARCWPSRASIMSGYYAQQVRMDPQQKKSGPPEWTRLLSHHLRLFGYRCYQSGKWHISIFPNINKDGGFDRSYHLTDHDRNFNPKSHMEDDKALPAIKPGTTHYSTTYIADHAIRCLKEHAAKNKDDPFFQYLCFTVPHFPLHAPAEDIARYKDTYLKGWEQTRAERHDRAKKIGIVNCPLPAWEEPTPSLVYKKLDLKTLGKSELDASPAWNKLTNDQQRFQATKMAIHAAMVDRMDQESGRGIDQLKAMNALDDTIIIFLSDNGASAEVMVRGDGHDLEAALGSAASYLCLGGGWAAVANTPFRRFKIWVYEGGVATPFIIHWPAGLPQGGGLRHDVGHLIDVAPTLLELTGSKKIDKHNGVQSPPFPGRSLVPSFAKDTKAEREIYFNHSGHKALRAGDWKIVYEKDGAGWELYDLATDRCESKNLAAKHPERVREMSARWQKMDEQWKADAK